MRRATIPLRYAFHVTRPSWTEALRLLPQRVQRRIGLDPEASGSRKIELGGGPFPLPGYIHVDNDPRSLHLEAVAPADDLPFEAGFAEELVAIHLFEHVHPTAIDRTLAEWLRVLQPGGVLQLHVPDFEALSEAYFAAAPGERWPFMSAILGMYSAADAGKMDIVSEPDHKLVLTWDTLKAILEDAGFVDVRNVSGEVTDRHTEGWKPVMPQISLVVQAKGPGWSSR